jgi:hypothetical protein
MKKIILVLIGLISSFLTHASNNTCPLNRVDYFCIPTNQIQNSEMTITEFYKIPATIIGLYQNEMKSLPLAMALDAQWESPYFGAGVSLIDNSFRLMILGGMARMKEMTLDGYAAIVCHEIGHIVGGEPRQTIYGVDWSSAEGQADFFSASICLPKYFKSLGMNSEQEIKNRIEKAGYDFLSLAKVVESKPQNKILSRGKINLPAVNETIINLYPSTQCRYETYRDNSKRSTCWYKN